MRSSFSPDGRNLQAADVLYKKNILAIRGSFRPVTQGQPGHDPTGTGHVQARKTGSKRTRFNCSSKSRLNNLKAEGDIDEKDFLDRADILCSLGQTVLISNYQEYYKLIEYFSRYTKRRMGVIMGGNAMMDLFNERYYRDLNGGILEAFGIMFSRDLKVYAYPWHDAKNDVLIRTDNAPIHPRIKPLYDYLLFNKRITDIQLDDLSLLDIFSVKS